MVRGGKVSCKRNFKKRVRSKVRDSDDSDEDYVISDEVKDVSEDGSEDYCSSLDDYASDESFDSFVVEEIEGARKFNGSKSKDGVCGQRKTASKTSRKRGRITFVEEIEEKEENKDGEGYDAENGDGDCDFSDDEDEEFTPAKDDCSEGAEIEGMRKFNASKSKNGVCGQRKTASKTSQKRGRITCVEEIEEKEENKDDYGYDVENADGDCDYDDDEDEEFTPDKDDCSDEEEIEGMRKFNGSKSKNGVCGQREIGCKTSRKRGRVTCVEQTEGKEETKDDDYDVENGNGNEDCDYDDDKDEEFTPDEDDCSDEDEEPRVKRKKNSMKTGKQMLIGRRKSKAPKKPLGKKRRKDDGLTRKVICDDEGDFRGNAPDVRVRSKKKSGRGRRRLVVSSDSDFVSSGSPDYDYTISEEEREQVREAKELFGSLRTSLRSSSVPKKTEEGWNLCQQRKPPGRKSKEEPLGRKGKEKIEDVKTEVGKQWAKVESRCPVCKQRFTTISKPTSKPARSTAGMDLREVVIQVPERDQVYQPSEEELRSYIDPYEYVICSECHEGGDDSLMLLCDLCDSPAHTFCVGLGRQVPEGNWYCDGCRPVALGSSSSQAQECVPRQRMTNQNLPSRPSPLVHAREGIDLNLMSSPHTSFNQGFGNLSSPRFMVRSVQVASPVSGRGAPTLSGRRWIHRHIQQRLSADRMSSMAGRSNGIPTTISGGNNLFNSQIDQPRETTPQQTWTPAVGTSYHTFLEERLCDNTSPLLQSRNFFPMRITNSRQLFQDSAASSNNRPVNGMSWPGLGGTSTVSDVEQLHQCSNRSNIGTDGILLPFSVREESDNCLARVQLQSMIESHLRSLSRNVDLDHNTFKDIAQSSTQAILAACGLEHKSEICTVHPPPACPHIELTAGGPISLIKGCCSSCFDFFVGDVVKRIVDTKISNWLSLAL
ncbi:PHD and RING finger domain-containing protein [Quillaja saponaria]|uniref:PHD and RING finger domain-containing protein n=1 Tax=Quillaja saponaria TaxID=32244 RepID=A0AAD7Q1V6_QUISA|nr:PHD and RING finger domain-containing protein [Quillaja saponaria]